MAQPVITKIQRIDDLRGQAAQGVLHAREIGFHRYFPMVAFREDIRQPDHGRPSPTYPPLRPMAGDMPVQDLRQTHLDHLSDEQSHIINALCDHHQVALPKDLPGLLCQLHSHDTLLCQAGAAWQRASQLNVLGSKYSHPQAQAPLEIKLLVFLYGEWGEISQPFTNLLTLRSTNLLTLRAVLRANPPTCKEFEVVFTNLSTFHKSLNPLISKILSINDLQTRKTVVSVTIEKTSYREVVHLWLLRKDPRPGLHHIWPQPS